MNLRVEQLVGWVAEFATPLSVWISGLFNPMAYITAILQTTARRTSQSLDKMEVQFKISISNFSMGNTAQQLYSALDVDHFLSLLLPCLDFQPWEVWTNMTTMLDPAGVTEVPEDGR